MPNGDWRQDVERVWIIGDGKPNFSFDTVISESHVSEIEITSEPVETGVEVSDHAFVKPKRLEIYAEVSDVWLGMRDADQDRVGPLKPDKDWLVSSAAGDSSSRTTRAYELLIGLQESLQPFAVQTGLRLYNNMMIEGLYPVQDARSASLLAFRATLRELIITNTQTVKYPPRAPKKTTYQASAKTISGTKQAVPPVPEKVKSQAFKIGQAVGAIP